MKQRIQDGRRGAAELPPWVWNVERSAGALKVRDRYAVTALHSERVEKATRAQSVRRQAAGQPISPLRLAKVGKNCDTNWFQTRQQGRHAARLRHRCLRRACRGYVVEQRSS